MQIERHPRPSQSVRKHQTVLDRHRLVLIRVPDETRRRLRRDLQLVGEQPDQFRGRIIAEQIALRAGVRVLPHRDDGITQHAQIRTTTLPLDRVSRVGLARVEMCEQRRRQMSACRRSHNADPLRVDPPLCRLGARQPHPPHRILQHARMPVPVRAQPIIQHKRADAVFVEPDRILFAFARRQADRTHRPDKPPAPHPLPPSDPPGTASTSEHPRRSFRAPRARPRATTP